MSREVPEIMTQRWLQSEKVGDARPVVRATITVQNMHTFDYDTAWVNGGEYDTDRHRKGHYASFIFGDTSPVKEIRNILSCEWERSVDQDVATCTLRFLNSEMTPIGSPRDNPTSPDELDKPGYFTYNRGQSPFAGARWGHDADTGWQGTFVPDRVVRTYEGYGCDTSVFPGQDENLVISGTWLIDKVTYEEETAIVTLEMRDFGRLLLDQIVFPPVIPAAEYPLAWVPTHSEFVDARDCHGGEWVERLRPLGSASSSNEKYVGKGLTNAPYSSYVTSSGGVNGHHASHVLSLSSDTDIYWQSSGQDTIGSKVWWQFDFDEHHGIGGVRLLCKGGPYRVYVSVHNGGKWLGKREIPYEVTTGDVDIAADIPFVKSVIADRAHPFDIILPRAYNAKKIRITFSRLRDSGVGEHPYYAALRNFQVYIADNKNDITFSKGKVLKVFGNYGDYTQIVKWICAWSGFYWPTHGTGMDFIKIHNDTDKVWFTPAASDPVLTHGRVWGDFMRTYTTGDADLTVDMFDKKPVMDVINYVRDLTGFNFWVDEMGGIVWRMPNIWSEGNYASPDQDSLRTRTGRTSEIVELDEETNLLSYQTVLDSSNIRDRIFVANNVGGVATVARGFNPYPVGLRRIAGWTDQHFKNKRDTRIMADMINTRSMFAYRRGHAVIPGYPAIQIDDQVRIFARVTNETYYHYVMSIKSSIDMEEGVWTYDLETHWLGEDPSTNWVVDVDELENVTKVYLAAIGYLPANDPEDKPN